MTTANTIPLHLLPSLERATLQHKALIRFLQTTENDNLRQTAHELAPNAGCAKTFAKCFPDRRFNGCFFCFRQPILACLRRHCQPDTYDEIVEQLQSSSEDDDNQKVPLRHLMFQITSILQKHPQPPEATNESSQQEDLLHSESGYYQTLQAVTRKSKEAREQIWKACIQAAKQGNRT